MRGSVKSASMILGLVGKSMNLHARVFAVNADFMKDSHHNPP
jgi:hypothetical protein